MDLLEINLRPCSRSVHDSKKPHKETHMSSMMSWFGSGSSRPRPIISHEKSSGAPMPKSFIILPIEGSGKPGIDNGSPEGLGRGTLCASVKELGCEISVIALAEC